MPRWASPVRSPIMTKRNASGGGTATSSAAATSRKAARTTTVPANPRLFDCIQGLLEIRKQIAPVFNTHRYAYQAVSDARAIQFERAIAGMSGRSGMTGESFDPAERHGVLGNPELAQEGQRRRFPAPKIQREDTARVIALL